MTGRSGQVNMTGRSGQVAMTGRCGQTNLYICTFEECFVHCLFYGKPYQTQNPTNTVK